MFVALGAADEKAVELGPRPRAVVVLFGGGLWKYSPWASRLVKCHLTCVVDLTSGLVDTTPTFRYATSYYDTSLSQLCLKQLPWEFYTLHLAVAAAAAVATSGPPDDHVAA